MSSVTRLGYFLKGFNIKFSCKRSPKIGQIFGLALVNTVAGHFMETLDKNWATFKIDIRSQCLCRQIYGFGLDALFVIQTISSNSFGVSGGVGWL